MNVQDLNEGKSSKSESYRSLLLLNEISQDSAVSQRELSRKLNIALGLVNSYMRNLVAKGMVKISEIPPRRYAYYLTPKGFAEKSRLTYQVLRSYTALYRDTRRQFLKLFRSLAESGHRRFLFAGIDELAEIALLSLQESEGILAGIVDEERAGERFFKMDVLAVDQVGTLDFDAVIITGYLAGSSIWQRLVDEGVPGDLIFSVGQGAGEDAGERPDHGT